MKKIRIKKTQKRRENREEKEKEKRTKLGGNYSYMGFTPSSIQLCWRAHTHQTGLLILPPHLRLTSHPPSSTPTNLFNTAAVVAAGHAAPGSTGTAGPHGDQGRRETLHFPGQDDRARAAALRVATLAVAAGGSLTPEAGAAAGARSWRTGRADPCPTESAREEDAAAAGWASAAEG